MNRAKTNKMTVDLGASQVRRRLAGHGFGVRKVESAGRKRAVIVHTATGAHLRQLEAFFHDVLAAGDLPSMLMLFMIMPICLEQLTLLIPA